MCIYIYINNTLFIPALCETLPRYYRLPEDVLRKNVRHFLFNLSI